MDQDLLLMVTPPVPAPPGKLPKLEKLVRLLDPESPEIEVRTPDGTRPYTLKALGALYGQGTGAPSINTLDKRFEPLLMSIEEPIVRYSEDVEPALGGGRILLVLKSLSIDPEAEQSERLARRINISLRLKLSVDDFSRQDVRGCIRQVGKSVDRHTRLAGPRGYVEFVRQFLPRRR